MENMDSSHEQNFLSHYQKLLFEEQDADPYEIASIRRKCLAQMFKASIPLSNNITTCTLYEKNLKSYSDIVDNQNNVNNYADSIQTHLSFSQPECSKWKSSLDVGFKRETFHCNSHDVEEEDIEFLVQACKADKFEKADESPKFPSTSSHNENKQEFFRKRKDTAAEDEKEHILPKKHSVKNGDIARQNVLPVGKYNAAFPNNYNSLTMRSTPEASANSSWNSKASGGNFWKPSTSSVTYNTIQNTVPQEQNIVSTLHSHPPNEAKYPNIQKPSVGFFTAREELIVQNQKKWGSRNPSGCDYGAQKKSLGNTRRNVMNKFIPPVKTSEEECGGMVSRQEPLSGNEEVEDERLKNIDPKMVELIRNEIMDSGAPVHWDDIAGLQFAKTTIQEIVVWPMLRPEIFTGLRRPPKGILLFGPPGTGKTLIGKCIASQSHSTFFSISASSLTSKWIGDGEKMVRALFAVARCHQPAVIFIDEIDSLLTQRSDTEHESSRRIKTEFLVQLDGATTGEEDRILVVGATNRPQELDEAARRRLVKRLYIPLPDHEARCQIVQRLMYKEHNCLTPEQISEIGSLADGYSGADVKNVCQEASLGPIRSINFMDIQSISPDEVRPITFEDFQSALKRVRASVSSCDLDVYLKWDKTYGSG